MTPGLIIEKTKTFVKTTLDGAEGGHDWFHIKRVLNNSLLIAKEEDADLLVVSLGALLHDIADAKFHNGDETIGSRLAKNFLASLELDTEIISHIVKIIENISFKSSFKKGVNGDNFNSLELQIVQDADRLDAIGAIGIARAFNYGGFRNRELYNPEIKPNLKMTKEEYTSSNAPTLNHFYEKLLLLKNTMNTKTGSKLAAERHHFMELYLDQFYKEWGDSNVF